MPKPCVGHEAVFLLLFNKFAFIVKKILLPFNYFLHYNIEEENYNSLKSEIIVAGLQVQQIIRTVVNWYGLLFFVLRINEVKMSEKRLISLLIAMILLFFINYSCSFSICCRNKEVSS